MSATAVARGVIALIAASLLMAGPAHANDAAAHKMAEKFAGSTDGGAEPSNTENGRVTAAAKKADKDKAETKKKEAEHKAKEAERKAKEAKHRAEQHKAEAQRKVAEAKRRAAENASRVTEQRKADEAEMLARAQREAEEMRTNVEQGRLEQEARRLIEEAQKERAKAEALLATQAEQQRKQTAEDERLSHQRTEETRRLAEKLNRVRQIRDARLAAQARRAALEKGTSAASPEPQPAPVAQAMPAVRSQPETPPSDPPPAATAALPEAAPAAAADPKPPAKASQVAAEAASPQPSPSANPPASAAPAPAAPSSVPQAQAAPPPVAAPPPAATAATEDKAERLPPIAAKMPGRESETRVTVLLILEPGTYGIRRRGPKVADPVLCMPEGCYVSAGADRPAVFMPGHRALGFGNTMGARAGACSRSLGCIFRDVELSSLPGQLQPVDLHILRHDRRSPHTILADSTCSSSAGRLSCSHGIYAEDYVMWVVPESLADAVGPDVLERALGEGLNGPRSAALQPRQ